MKILTIDIGNTSVDMCLFERELKYIGKFSHSQIPKVEADIVLISSVKPSANAYVMEKYPQGKFIKAQEIPIETSSFEKEKVGVDRLLNLYGAMKYYGDNLVLVSAGTALVIDLLIDGIFQGGFIAIGISTGIDCLSKRAELIPEMKLEEVFVDIGKNTKEAIIGGSIKQARYFILGCLKDWKENYGKDLRLVITGGDGHLFGDLGIYDPLLIHKGMLTLFGIEI